MLDTTFYAPIKDNTPVVKGGTETYLSASDLSNVLMAYKDANGAKQESVEYHNIVMFARQAEVAGQYLKRGQSCLIEGRIQTRSWDDAKTGEKKYRTEIMAESMQMGPKAGVSAYSGNSNSSASDDSNTAPTQTSGKQELDTIDYGEMIDPNDIPF